MLMADYFSASFENTPQHILVSLTMTVTLTHIHGAFAMWAAMVTGEARILGTRYGVALAVGRCFTARFGEAVGG